ncbi:MAG: ParA family protein [Spirosoma sp.]|nr:ParA family protein [Spirosoma sp.]
MAKIIVVASSKGGVGKTLVSMVLASRLATEGLRVGAIDADPNGALADWRANVWDGPSFVVEAEADAARLAHRIPDLAATTDLLIVDTAGFGNQAAAAAIASADAVIVPMLASRADIAEATRTVQLAQGLARAARRDIPARVLRNKVNARTAVAQHARVEVESAGLPLLATTLSQVVAYTELTHNGRLPRQAPAAMEIERLVDELRSAGWLPPRAG